jgi:hypothetical protein
MTYVAYETDANSYGQAVCLRHIEEDPVVRGFLRAGAARICRATHLKSLSEVAKHFYLGNELPTNKAEYISQVRDLEDISEDPWFNQEAGLKSIIALVKKILVGDLVLVSQEEGYHDIWQGGFDKVADNALQHDGFLVDAPIKPNREWVI